LDADARACEQRQSLRKVFVSENRLQVLLNIDPAPAAIEELLQELPALWSSLNIAATLDVNQVRDLLDAAVKGGLAGPLCIASGTPPQPPVHGRIAWGGAYFEQGFEMDPVTGVVNYRRRSARTAVAEKECLAVVHPPIEGLPGIDVFGKAIPSVPARRAILERGDNVSVSEDGSQFFAAREGHIRLLGNRLCVDETYSLANVGLKSGDIDHPGALEVNGDVEPGSHVRTTGNIYIAGLVEEASIECGGDLTVCGGIVGAEDRRIRVSGNLHARYLAHATLDVDGDIVVEREIDQCQIHCRGALLVPEGRIVGGHAMAMGGILVNEAGSHGSIPTHLVAGEDDNIRERLHEVREDIEKHAHAIARIRDALTPLMPIESHLDAHQHEAVLHLQEKLQLLSAHHHALEEEEHTLHENAFHHAGRRIDVRSWLHSDVVLGLGGYQLRIEESIQGPLHATVGEEGIHLHSGATASHH